MTAQTREQQLQEIKYQTKMLDNLKRWIRNLILLSSVGVAVAYWALRLQEGTVYHVVGVFCIILMIICVALCAVIGFAFKNGKANVDKIKNLVQKESQGITE